MSGIIYIEPRNNPEYLYYQVITDINSNFSNLYSGGSGVFLSVTGGTISGDLFVSGATSAVTYYSAATPLESIIYQIATAVSASGGTGVFLPLTGGTLTGAISGTSANFSGPIYSANTDLYQIFIANYDTLNGGEW